MSIALAAATVLALTSCSRVAPVGQDDPADVIVGRVQSVMDGDSITVDGREVRLIGINAPEREAFGADAARDALEGLVGGHSVRLVPGREAEDRHGRALAHVFRMSDDTFVNAEMVRLGQAHVLVIPPNDRYLEALLEAEREAILAGRGLWEPSPVPLAIGATSPDPPGPDEDNLNGEWIELRNHGTATVALRGLILHDAANRRFTLPELQLPPTRSIRIHSGRGRDRPDAIFAGSLDPWWNNGGDVAFVRDRDGRLIDHRRMP